MSKMSKRDMNFFDMARRVAEQSTFEGFHLGCVITYKGRVLSSACNSNKTHPLQKYYNKRYRHFKKSKKPVKNSLHAEIASLIEIPKCVENNIDYSKCKVYIYRISPGKRLKIGMARPCAGCLAALRDKGVRTIYYTTDEGFCREELY